MRTTKYTLAACAALMLLFCTIGAKAQPGQHFRGRPDAGSINSWAYISGMLYLSPGEEGGEEIPGAGAVVTVIPIKELGKGKATDTLHVTVGNSGRFMMRNVPVGSAYVAFSMLGYEDQAKTVQINPGENKMLVNLKPKSLELEGAVVKESVPPISIKGDTIVFNPAAVKYNKGEMAIDILEQMPGVEVSESSVTVLNETVTNVYVDGSLLFGSAPMKALQNMPADEVMSIKSYQEYANKDPHHKISKNESKERVLDIQTKSKPKSLVNLSMTAGAGYDTDTTYHKFRYTVGSEFMRFSEKFQLTARASVNNINDGSIDQRGHSFRTASGGGSADLRSLTLNLSATYKWMSPTVKNYVLGNMGLAYSYDDNYRVNESISERIYFPTDKYDYRRYESSSLNESGSKSHTFRISGLKALRDGSVSGNVSYSISDNSSNNLSSAYNWQDELAPQGTSSSTTNSGGSRGLSANLSASKRWNNLFSLSGSLSFSSSEGDSGSTKIDSTTSTITNTVLDISTGSKSHSMSGNLRMGYELSDRSSINLSYNYNNSFSESLRYAYDISDPELPVLDNINTQLRTNSSNKHTGSLNLNSAIIEEKMIMNASLAYSSSGINRTDDFPTQGDSWKHRYNMFTPSVSFHNNNSLDSWTISWVMNGIAPTLEQVRPRIDNSNLYNVSAGNPNLKQSSTHSVSANFNSVLGKKSRLAVKEMKSEDRRPNMQHIDGNLVTMESSLSFATVRNVICSHSTYYTQETFLPDYNYTMPAQSTFSTYANAGNSYSARASLKFGIPVAGLFYISPSLSLNWDESPSYVDGVLTITDNTRPNLYLGFRSTFSRNIRLNLSGSASYVHSATNTGGRMDYFTEAVRAGAEINNILKIFYLGGNYTKTFMQGIQRANVNDNILDLSGGMRFGPKNQYNISLKVHDLFNKATGFSTSTNMDYVSNSWSHNFGRYVLLRFNYRFNQLGNKGRGGFGH